MQLPFRHAEFCDARMHDQDIAAADAEALDGLGQVSVPVVGHDLERGPWDRPAR
jgi:hypothetical protein